MKQLPCLLIFLLASISSYSQIAFEPGYFIDNQGKRTACEIRNADWKNNPSEFTYRVASQAETVRMDITRIASFGFDNGVKYERHTVDLDRSTDDLNALLNNSQPVFNKEQLFLKVLTLGHATLFYYEDNNLRRFFYRVLDSEINPLIYKRYLKSSAVVGKNMAFRQQLWNDLKCEGISQTQIDRLQYKKDQLVHFFNTYNQCKDPSLEIAQSKASNFEFHLALRPGVNLNSLEIKNSLSNFRNTDFGSNIGIRLGVEFEAKFPFNNGKWSLFFEPTYQTYTAEAQSIPTNFIPPTSSEVDYKSFELPLGIRHYMFLNNKSRIFLNAAFVYDTSLGSKIAFGNGSELDIESLTNWAFGIGYKYGERLALEFRYTTNRELLREFVSWESRFGGYSLILGYSIF